MVVRGGRPDKGPCPPGEAGYLVRGWLAGLEQGEADPANACDEALCRGRPRQGHGARSLLSRHVDRGRGSRDDGPREVLRFRLPAHVQGVEGSDLLGGRAAFPAAEPLEDEPGVEAFAVVAGDSPRPQMGPCSLLAPCGLSNVALVEGSTPPRSQHDERPYRLGQSILWLSSQRGECQPGASVVSSDL